LLDASFTEKKKRNIETEHIKKNGKRYYGRASVTPSSTEKMMLLDVFG